MDVAASLAEQLKSVPGFWYLGTPYSLYPHGIHNAFVEACRAAAWLKKQGVNVYCPIAETHPIGCYGDMDLLDGKLWQGLYEPIIAASCGLIVCKMEGWERSEGLRIEREIFARQVKPVIFMEWPRP